MKKFSFFAAILAAVTMLFTACPHPPVPPTTIVYDGFYVIGEATNVPTLTSEGADLSVMSPGYNENSSNEIRDGLYEKYIASKVANLSASFLKKVLLKQTMVLLLVK